MTVVGQLASAPGLPAAPCAIPNDPGTAGPAAVAWLAYSWAHPNCGRMRHSHRSARREGGNHDADRARCSLPAPATELPAGRLRPQLRHDRLRRIHQSGVACRARRRPGFRRNLAVPSLPGHLGVSAVLAWAPPPEVPWPIQGACGGVNRPGSVATLTKPQGHFRSWPLALPLPSCPSLLCDHRALVRRQADQVSGWR
jgi:hypothetical protein